MSREPDSTDDQRTARQEAVEGRTADSARSRAPGGADAHGKTEGLEPATPEYAPTATGPDSGEPRNRPMSPAAAWSATNLPTEGRETTGGPPETEASTTRGPGEVDATEPFGTSGEWDRLPPPVFEPGRVVFGKYRLVAKVGEGGMGEVWKVHNIELDRTSAMKLIKAEIAQNDKGWTRFQREARLMAKLNHSNAVAVYDFRRTHSMGYIEMEFIQGRGLDQILKENPGQPLPLDRVAEILDQLCSVLQEAHGHRDAETGKPKPIIHRDLKPSNLMLVERGQPGGPVQLKVLDFGIAKMIEDDSNVELTGANDMIGTPAYMSPEQIQVGFGGEDEKGEVDARSDIYSTGIVLYHLLTGTLPFRGNKMTLLASHLHNKPMEIKEANPATQVPSAVERVVMQCLEKDPARRPQSARELAEMFRQAAGIAGGPAPAARAQALPWLRVAAVAGILLLAAGVGIPMVRAFRKPAAGPADPGARAEMTKEASTSAEPSPSKAKTKETDLAAVPETKAWLPRGFVADTASAIKAGGLPAQIKREDGALFKLYQDGMYLPAGYRPQGAEQSAGQWPTAIVRESDEARFVRIDGGVFLQGDTRREPRPALDAPGNPLTPHHVRVRGFYVQDREVTNGEIQKYRDAHPEEAESLSEWSRWYDDFRDQFKLEDDAASRFPALSISYRTARRYAASVGGLLPTESQWEFAARSRQDGHLFAWGETIPTARDRLANLDSPQHAPAPAGSFPKDKTDQGVRDMTGNVRELCADAYKPYDDLGLSGNAPDHPFIDRREALVLDTAMLDRIKVVVRGGSFMDKPQKAMAFMRDRLGAAEASNYVGFRVVIECPSRADESAEDQP
jgi:serine/threonine protein kinase